MLRGPARIGARGMASLAGLRRTAAEAGSRPVKTALPTDSITSALNSFEGGRLGALVIVEEGEGASAFFLFGVPRLRFPGCVG